MVRCDVECAQGRQYEGEVRVVLGGEMVVSCEVRELLGGEVVSSGKVR